MEDADTRSFILAMPDTPSSYLLARDDQRFLLMSFVRFPFHPPCYLSLEGEQRKHKTYLTGQCFSNREDILGCVGVFARSWLSVASPVNCSISNSAVVGDIFLP
jgi:hypothetical protein